MSVELDQLRQKISTLETELKTERDTRKELQQIVDDFASDTEKVGLVGESILRRIIGKQPTTSNEGYDFLCRNGQKLEVKFSRIGYPDRNKRETKRWSWAKLFGTSGNKEFDRLILIGMKHDEDQNNYQEHGSKSFIFFDIPFENVAPLTVKGDRAGAMIRLTTNPATVTSHKAKDLYSKYLVSAETLKSRYAS